MASLMADPRVSKGGLLYHLRSKGALIDGLAERLRAYTEANMALARREGVVRTFLATSTPGSQESRALLGGADRDARQQDRRLSAGRADPARRVCPVVGAAPRRGRRPGAGPDRRRRNRALT